MQTDLYSKVVNNGGNIKLGTLIFISPQNIYEQNSGTTKLSDYSGGGQIVQNNGTLNFLTLDSDATITSNGGIVEANRINLSKKTFSAKNTQLKTGLDQVADFQQIIAKAQGLLMASNDSGASLNASVLGRTEKVNSVLSQFKNNVSWSGGSFYFKGSYTKSVADSAIKLIQQTYGTNVGVDFESVVDDPTPADVVNGFTAAVANAIINENAQTEGVIFHQYAFDARNNDLVVGREDGVTSSVGFKNLNGSHGALVTGGKTLVLLGEDDASNIATGQLSAKDGTIRLGTLNTAVKVGGVISSVNLQTNGLLDVVRGTYTVNQLTGNGNVAVNEGNLTINGVNFEGDIENNATLNLGKGAIIGSGSNIGTLNISTVEINDVFTNTGFANITGAWNFGANGQYEHTAGTLTTIQDNLFENVNFSEIDPLNTITLGQSVPQDIKTTMTELFQKYVPGNVVESIAQHATFNGGKVIVSGVNLTETMVDDLTTAFKETFFIRFPKAFPKLSAPYLWA